MASARPAISPYCSCCTRAQFATAFGAGSRLGGMRGQGPDPTAGSGSVGRHRQIRKASPPRKRNSKGGGGGAHDQKGTRPQCLGAAVNGIRGPVPAVPPPGAKSANRKRSVPEYRQGRKLYTTWFDEPACAISTAEQVVKQQDLAAE